MRNIFLLTLFLILAAPLAAQEKCGLAFDEAPSFFNLRLGTTTADVKTIFGKSLKLKIRKEGSFFQNFITKTPPPFLTGVRALYLRFFDYKLYQIEVFYQAENQRYGDEPRKLAEFVDTLSASKNLPVRVWTKTAGQLRFDCAGFSLIADNVLNPRIELTDTAAFARFNESEQRKKR